MNGILRWLLSLLILACVWSASSSTTPSSEKKSSPLSAEEILCIEDVIKATPNVDIAKVEQVLFAFGRYNFGFTSTQTISSFHDLLNFGLREKHTNLTQSQWNAALNKTSVIQSVLNFTLNTDIDESDFFAAVASFAEKKAADASEFIDAVASIVDLEQKSKIEVIFNGTSTEDKVHLSRKWYLFSMALKNYLGIDPTPFYALLHGDSNNTLCSNLTITKRDLLWDKKQNITNADIYFQCIQIFTERPLLDLHKVKHYLHIFDKANVNGGFYTTAEQSDAVLELFYMLYIRYAYDLSLPEWKSTFETRKGDEVNNIFADGSLSTANLTIYKERIEKVSSLRVSIKVIRMLTALSKCTGEKKSAMAKCDQNAFDDNDDNKEFAWTTSTLVRDTMNDILFGVNCKEVDEKIPYWSEELRRDKKSYAFCLNQKSYCNGKIDKNSIFYITKHCENYVHSFPLSY